MENGELRQTGIDADVDADATVGAGTGSGANTAAMDLKVRWASNNGYQDETGREI